MASKAIVVADLYRMAEAVREVVKKKAYTRAAEAVSILNESELLQMSRHDLQKLPGIGAASSGIIDDILRFGASEKVEAIALPRGSNLTSLRGIGVAGAKKLIEKYGALTIAELAEKLEDTSAEEPKLQAAIAFHFTSKERRPWFEVREVVSNFLQAFERHALTAVPAGSYRRFSATVGDLDFVVQTTDILQVKQILSDAFPNTTFEASGAEKILCSIQIPGTEPPEYVHADFICAAPEDFGASLNHLTGSRDFNTSLRSHAKALGYRISEHGIECIATGVVNKIPREQDLFDFFNLPFIEPPKRQRSFKEAVATNFITADTEKLALHMHSTESDGALSPEQMLTLARASGFTMVGISDHAYPHPSGIRDLPAYAQRLQPLSEVGLLLGIEAELTLSGIPDATAALYQEFLDYAVLSCHISPEKNVIQRLVETAQKLAPLPVIIGHVTGRLLGRRPGAELTDLAPLRALSNCVLEINAHLDRLDPPSQLLQTWDGPVVISVDLHSPDNILLYEYGMYQSWKGNISEEQLDAAKDLILRALKPARLEAYLRNLGSARTQAAPSRSR